tara:strand:+ start:816 stop:1124 length:309 start_codon:yes stop_codon:yes gene_type:complete
MLKGNRFVMEKKTIWLCKYKIKVWKEVFSNKTKSINLSHLHKEYNVEGLLKGNSINDLKSSAINEYAYSRLKTEYAGKYSAKVEITEITERLSSHGLTQYEI